MVLNRDAELDSDRLVRPVAADPIEDQTFSAGAGMRAGPSPDASSRRSAYGRRTCQAAPDPTPTAKVAGVSERRDDVDAPPMASEKGGSTANSAAGATSSASSRTAHRSSGSWGVVCPRRAARRVAGAPSVHEPRHPASLMSTSVQPDAR